MIRKVVAAVFVAGSGLWFTVYVATNSPVQRQVDELADAGITANRNCTCPVRLDEDFARDAGLGLYQRALFPCSVRTMADGGRDVQMPPMPIQRVRDSMEVPDWEDCSIAASSGPVAALWGTQRPFTLAGVVKPWCRAKLDAGLPCLRLWSDGGVSSFGDRNRFPCAQANAPATCERVPSQTVFFNRLPDGGDDSEEL